MFIAICNSNFVPIQCPDTYVLVISNVLLRSSYNKLGFICIENYPIFLPKLVDDVEGSLQSPGGAGQQVGVISHSHCSYADWSNGEAKIGIV